MDRLNEWIKLTNNKLDLNDAYIHSDHLMLLDIPELKGWIIREQDVPDYQNYYPIKTMCNGIRYSCIYVNINDVLPRLKSGVSYPLELAKFPNRVDF